MNTKDPFNNTSFFSEKLNSNFKEYIHTDNLDYLSHFEKAVMHAIRRNDRRNLKFEDETTAKNKNLNDLSCELKTLQASNKKLTNEVDALNKKLEQVYINSKLDQKKKCTIL